MIRRAFVFASLTAAASAADMTHFEQRIRPLLIENCIECHGPDKQKGGLRLDSREGWQTGVTPALRWSRARSPRASSGRP